MEEFKVITLHREDLIEAAGSGGSNVSDELVEKIKNLPDDVMEGYARKIADGIMNGSDFWTSAKYIVDNYIKKSDE
jgi:hypothetical protein